MTTTQLEFSFIKSYPATPTPPHRATVGSSGRSDTWDRVKLNVPLASSKSECMRDRKFWGWTQKDKTYLRCPFHQERTPSCVYVGERKFFYCFGCAKGGDLETLVNALPDARLLEALHTRRLAADAEIEEMDERDIPF